MSYPKLIIRATPIIQFVVWKDERTYKQLIVSPEDLVDFCCKIYSSGFCKNCYGDSTASLLEYQWVTNTLVVHTSTPQHIKLTMGNVDDINRIACPHRKANTRSATCTLF